MKMEYHGGHYYGNPSLWDLEKIISKAQESAGHTGHTQLIHPHKYGVHCGNKADHIVVYPDGVAESIRVFNPPSDIAF
jgi:hypothetical protein